MQFSEETALQTLAHMGMDDMPVATCARRTPNIPADWFSQYRQLSREFMISLADSVEELAMLNLSQDDFMALLMGQRVPNNMSIRFRHPLIWGGELSMNNLFMCRTFPHSNNMDKFLIMQSDAQSVWIPNPAKKIYTPSHAASGGDGGNATEDRLSQLAAQIASGRDI